MLDLPSPEYKFEEETNLGARNCIPPVENTRCGGNDLWLGFYGAEWNGLCGEKTPVLCGDEDHD